MKTPFMKTMRMLAAGAMAGAMLLSGPALADEWQPKGPINLAIGFAGGGGTDTIARLVASELEARHGWKIIPSNVTGRGGAIMVRDLKDDPADGTALGVAVTDTFGYAMLATRDPGYSVDDFTYISTLTGTQTALVVNASKGWKTWDDFVAAARTQTMKFGVLGQKHLDVNYLIEQKFGVEFNSVQLKGGRAVLNALAAGDIDIGYVSGIQVKAVAAGDMVNLVATGDERLPMSPDVPTLKEIGIPFSVGGDFILVAPKGLPEDARSAIAGAVQEILHDKNSEAYAFAGGGYTGPGSLFGPRLDAYIRDNLVSSQALLDATN